MSSDPGFDVFAGGGCHCAPLRSGRTVIPHGVLNQWGERTAGEGA
jgi:hypothetical protein